MPRETAASVSRSAWSWSVIGMDQLSGMAVAIEAAEQIVDRRIQSLADDVIEGDVDGALGARVPGQDAFHIQLARFDLARVFAEDGGQQALAQLEGDGRLRLPRAGKARHMRRLAQADDAFVGMEAQVDAFLVARGGEGHAVRAHGRHFGQNQFGMRDLHGGSLS